MEKLVLFRLEDCPYCKKVEEKLKEKNLAYKKIEVPKDKEKRTILKKISGQNSVPVLLEIIGAKEQDDEILAYLQKNY